MNSFGNLTKPLSQDRFIDLKEVMDLVGLKKSTIYQHIKEGKFPKQHRLSARAVRWSLDDICRWMDDIKAHQHVDKEGER